MGELSSRFGPGRRRASANGASMDRVVARLAADLDAAFPDLVRALQDDVFSGVLGMTGNWTEAEDVTQDAFVRAYRALRRYPVERIRVLQPIPWVWTIALNACRSHLRNRARSALPLPEPILDTADWAVGPEQAAVEAETHARWLIRLGELPPAMRDAVVLRHVVGMPYSELAEALGRPLGTVKADVHRGIRRLRAMLETEEES